MPVVVLALSSSLFSGVADFVGGLAARRMPVVAMTAVNYAVSAVVLIAACVLVRMEVSTAAIGSGIAAGAFAVVGFLAFYGALVTGAMSILSPIVAATQAAVPVLADVVLLGHRPSPIGWVGVSPSHWAAVCSWVCPSAAPERCASRRAFSPWDWSLA